MNTLNLTGCEAVHEATAATPYLVFPAKDYIPTFAEKALKAFTPAEPGDILVIKPTKTFEVPDGYEVIAYGLVNHSRFGNHPTKEIHQGSPDRGERGGWNCAGLLLRAVNGDE
tara:strand:+ start:5978 stop:6316 length:339 start_codon:yes stop_codon:yes gene_type:complete